MILRKNIANSASGSSCYTSVLHARDCAGHVSTMVTHREVNGDWLAPSIVEWG